MQSLTFQEMADEITPAFDSTVTSVTMSFGGLARSWLMLTGLVSGTRSEMADPMGLTDSWLLSLQPTVNWEARGLALTPAVSYSRVESDLGGGSENEQYQLILQWTPNWMHSLLGWQIASDWTRATMEGVPSPDFHQRWITSLTLRWGVTRSAATPVALAPLPAFPSEREIQLAKR